MSRADVRAPSGRALIQGVLLMAAGALAVLAALADVNALIGGPGTIKDVGVGLAFVVAGLAGSAPDLQRAWVASVGVAWLVGSVMPLAVTLHQGLLVAALVVFPSGRPVGPWRWLLLVPAAVATVGGLQRSGVALVFVAVAVVVWATSRSSAEVVYPVVAAASTAAALMFAGWHVDGLPSDAGVHVYQGVLVAVAVGFPVAVWGLARDRHRRVGAVLADPPEGLAGLVVLLRRAVGDESLSVTSGAAWASSEASGQATESTATRVLVSDGDEVLATVSAAPAVLDDEPTARAVAASVRLFLRNQKLREEQVQRLAALRESRARLVAAADRERERTAARLAREVGEPLARASRTLAALVHDAGGRGAGALAVALSELDGAAEDVRRLVAGTPPVPLGHGRLGAVLDELAGRWPDQVRVRHGDAAETDPAAETALFYVCSEAVANGIKHAAGAGVTIDLSRSGTDVVLTVRDEGPGGADPGGFGLLGLRDRMAAVDGTLEVHSPAGGGTTVVARVPVTVYGRTPGRQEHRDQGVPPPLE